MSENESGHESGHDGQMEHGLVEAARESAERVVELVGDLIGRRYGGEGERSEERRAGTPAPPTPAPPTPAPPTLAPPTLAPPTPAPPTPAPPESGRVVALVHDLIGRKYPEVGMKPHLVAMQTGPLDCYQLVREVVRRVHGWEMPATPEAAAALPNPIAVAVPWPPQVGDILDCQGVGEHPAHLAVVVDTQDGDGGGGWAIHSTRGAGVGMVRVGVLERAKQVRRVLRLVPPKGGGRWCGV